MKVAYVYYLAVENQIGIEEKVRQQARALKTAGLDSMDIIVLNPVKDETEGNLSFVKFKGSRFPLNYYDYFYRRYQLIERSVDLKGYETIILRYPLADKSGIEFCRKYKVISEHNTDELSELRSRLKTAVSPLEKIGRRILLAQEEKYAGPTLRNCRGMISVTGEIEAFERRRSGGRPAAITIANGIDVANIPFTGFKPFDGKQLDLLFVGTSFRPWHGIERIIGSLNQYQGKIELTLHLVGHITRQELAPLVQGLDRVRFHGPMNVAELSELTPTMNLAFSTMALFRKEMEEACSLKTREYTARGIPFILAYEDPDLKDVEPEYRFFLRFGNNESRLDMEKIIQFAQEMSPKNREISAYMRKYAEEKMDWQVKFKQYMAFIERLARTEKQEAVIS